MKSHLRTTLKAAFVALAMSALIAGRVLAADDPAPKVDVPNPAPAGTAPEAKPALNPEAPSEPAPSATPDVKPNAKVEAKGEIQAQGQVPSRPNNGNAQPGGPKNRQQPTRHQTNRVDSNAPNGPRAGVGANANANSGRNARGNANVGLTFGPNTGAGGLQISAIGPNSPFGDVGFQQGDQIISAGGQRFNNQDAFYGWMGTAQVGQRVPIIVIRGGQQQTVYWTPTAEFIQQYSQRGTATGQNFLGIYLAEDQQHAAVVADVEPNSPAHRAGVRPNDMIVAVSGQEVSNADEYADAVAQVPPGSAVDLAVSRTMNLQIMTGPAQTGVPQSVTASPAPPAVAPVPAQQYNPQPARRGLRRGR